MRYQDRSDESPLSTVVSEVEDKVFDHIVSNVTRIVRGTFVIDAQVDDRVGNVDSAIWFAMERFLNEQRQT